MKLKYSILVVFILLITTFKNESSNNLTNPLKA
jgi:hypothetical protein